jgi:hypothetical protein
VAGVDWIRESIFALVVIGVDADFGANGIDDTGGARDGVIICGVEGDEDAVAAGIPVVHISPSVADCEGITGVERVACICGEYTGVRHGDDGAAGAVVGVVSIGGFGCITAGSYIFPEIEFIVFVACSGVEVTVAGVAVDECEIFGEKVISGDAGAGGKTVVLVDGVWVIIESGVARLFPLDFQRGEFALEFL